MEFKKHDELKFKTLTAHDNSSIYEEITELKY